MSKDANAAEVSRATITARIRPSMAGRLGLLTCIAVLVATPAAWGDTPTTADSAPEITGTSPEIGGAAVVGRTLQVVSSGAWSGTPSPTYSYQWLTCSKGVCTPITDATGQNYTTSAGEVGEKIEVQVNASNSAGSATATSNQIGPLTTTPGVVQGVGPTTGQVGNALSKLLTPTGRFAKIPALLKAGGYTFMFNPPAAGKLTLTWTATVRHKKITVASASISVPGNSSRNVKLKLSRAGRSLLANSSRVAVSVSTSFKASTLPKVTISKGIKLT